MREHRRQRRKAHAHSRCQAVDDGSPAGKPGGRRQCLCEPRRLRAGRQRGSSRSSRRPRPGTSAPSTSTTGGVPKLDLKTATIGFAQSEKEANPFRIAETQSIKDEAAKLGIKLLTTNAQSDLNKEISDIKGMIDQGAQALIISPLNSEGLDPALDYAKEKKVPIMTIDRFLTTKAACKDYIGWVGSDFVEQGKRASDAMIAATGDTCKLAILLGAAGVNVTNDREQGFEDEMAAKASKMKVVAKQTARLRAGEGPDGHRAAHPGQPRDQLHLRPQRRDGARAPSPRSRTPASNRATSRS